MDKKKNRIVNEDWSVYSVSQLNENWGFFYFYFFGNEEQFVVPLYVELEQTLVQLYYNEEGIKGHNNFRTQWLVTLIDCAGDLKTIG